MRYATIQKAFLQDWDAQAFGIATYYPDRNAAPTSDHAELAMLPAGNDVKTLGGDGENDVTGIFQITLKFRTGRGNGEILEQADTICQAYPSGRIITADSQQVRIWGAQLNGPRSDNGWLRATISINFSAYVRRQA